MKVIILAGGFGTRLSEYTETIPKPMVTIGGKPILWHIMKTYENYEHKDFYLALGYKAELIKDYFLNYRSLNSDFTVDLNNGNFMTHQNINLDWKVTLVDTGLNSMTGGRVKRMKNFVGNETFLLTYGDGLTDINISDLVDFHNSHGKMVTVSAVHPGARFGELEMDGNIVTSFQEKPQTKQGWINGGYFVINPDFFDLIEDDHTILEQEPLERVSKMGELVAFQHKGFWQCMDTKRDRDYLEELWAENRAPWKN
jgi:glucose-1-phosphate cytidylyltransferase